MRAVGLLKKKKTWRNPGLARQFAFGELRACPSDSKAGLPGGEEPALFHAKHCSVFERF